MKRLLFIAFCAVLFAASGTMLFAQTYAAVPVEHPIYSIIAQAELRGLCRPLSKVKPYSEKTVINAINEIIAASDAADSPLLSQTEKEILYDTLEEFKRSEGTRLNSSHPVISYAVFCLKKKMSRIPCT